MNSITQSHNCGIYKITNLINGMSYIGQSRDIQKRWWSHKNGREKDHNYYIHNAISKYGIENFSFEILLVCAIDKLNYFEKKCIEKFNTIKPFGYNLEHGGNAHKIISVETRRKMSILKTGINHNFFGTHRSDETKRKISESQSKSVNQYTLEGNYIKTYQSLKSACFSLGLELQMRSHISSCCNGKRRQVHGYQWRYADNKNNIGPIRERLPMSKIGKKKLALSKEIPVSQFTKDGIFINTYESAKKAGQITGINWKVISACRTGKKKSAGGFIWRYVSNE